MRSSSVRVLGVLLAQCALVFILSSCSKDAGQVQSKFSGLKDESLNYAKSMYGNKVEVTAIGNFTANSNPDAIALVVRKNFGKNKYWIQKGCIMGKSADAWHVILDMSEKLRTPKGDLVPQVDAVNGYLISYDTNKLPLEITITIADEMGNSASDEIFAKWDAKQGAYVTDDDQLP